MKVYISRFGMHDHKSNIQRIEGKSHGKGCKDKNGKMIDQALGLCDIPWHR